MLAQGHLYHPYPGEPYKFIQCDQWGKAYVQDCPAGQRWDTLYETCVEYEATAKSGTSHDHSYSNAGTYESHSYSAKTEYHSEPKHSYSTKTEHTSRPKHSYSTKTEYTSEPKHSYSTKTEYTSEPKHSYPTKTEHHNVPQYSYSTKKTGHTSTPTKSIHTETKPNVHNSINHDYPPPANYLGSLPTNPLIHLILLAANQQAGHKKPGHTQPHGGKTNDEVCRESGNRYLPDRVDINWYYECKDGVAVARSCGPQLVWVQPLYQCMKLEHPLGGDSTDHSATEVSDLGRHNPCYNTDTQFHPWPGHPGQYLECRGQHAYLWSCAEGQLWSQELQACVVEETVHTHHIDDTPDGDNPCLYTASYYHPFIDNPSRFIQCDQFGNMFVMKCGPNKVWDDYLKTCVGRLNMSRLSHYGDPIDPNGLEYPTDNYSDTEYTDTTLPDGPPDSGTETLMGCPSDFHYDSSLHLCIKLGDDGEIDLAVDPASYHTSCPSGYRYDSSMGLCVQHTNGDSDSVDAMGPHCTPGMYWNAPLQMCVPSGFLPGDHSTTDSDTYTPDHSANYGYNDVTSSAARQARDIDYSRIPDHVLLPADSHPRYPDPIPPQDPEPPIYDGENPCGQGGGFYFPFPNYPHFYIQCDQMGKMYTQPCHYGHIWNDDLSTCVPDLGLPPPPTADPDAPLEAVDIHHVGGNPCPGSTHTYHPFANNDRLFIMCVGDVAYPMPCPYGAKWNDDISTCFWPRTDDDDEIADTIVHTNFLEPSQK